MLRGGYISCDSLLDIYTFVQSRVLNYCIFVIGTYGKGTSLGVVLFVKLSRLLLLVLILVHGFEFVVL